MKTILVGIGCLLGLGLVLVSLTSLSARAADGASCVSAAKQANLRCWDRCDGDAEAIEACVASCDAAFEQSSLKCQSSPRQARIAERGLSGSKKSGQDGCYFGECPDDLEKRIDEVEDDEPAPAPKPKSKTRPKRQPEPNPSPAALTQICQTPFFWCTMFESGPIYTPCWCGGPLGITNGITVPQR